MDHGRRLIEGRGKFGNWSDLADPAMLNPRQLDPRKLPKLLQMRELQGCAKALNRCRDTCGAEQLVASR